MTFSELRPFDDELNAAFVSMGWETARDYRDDVYADEWRRQLLGGEEVVMIQGDFAVYEGRGWSLRLETPAEILRVVRERDAAVARYLEEIRASAAAEA
ncbi:hypothetical protein ACRAWC_01795 [Leifsonia sp. L25]|uniref:hypothetical protein n=1 Tax=Actinomycetes TaxID=1760 RepID=UPI003D69C25B